MRKCKTLNQFWKSLYSMRVVAEVPGVATSEILPGGSRPQYDPHTIAHLIRQVVWESQVSRFRVEMRGLV